MEYEQVCVIIGDNYLIILLFIGYELIIVVMGSFGMVFVEQCFIVGFNNVVLCYFKYYFFMLDEMEIVIMVVEDEVICISIVVNKIL